MFKSVMYVQSCCFAIAFSPLSLPSSSSLVKLPNVVIQKFCYHGNVTSHFSLLSCYCIFKQVQARRRALRNHQQISIIYLTIRKQDRGFEFFADQLIPLSIVTVSIHSNQRAALLFFYVCAVYDALRTNN